MGSRAVPAYSISRDSWAPSSLRDSGAPSASMYSEDFENLYRDSRTPDIQPLRIQKPPPPSEYAHPQQQVHDYGQRVRNSRLPLFNQVRTMLHKPPTANGRAVNVRWDEYSGEISAEGKAPHVKPSTYKNPYEGTFEVRRRSTSGLARLTSTSSLSPVSTLREDELNAIAPVVAGQDYVRSESPVSSASVSPIDEELTLRISLTRPPKPQLIETPSPSPAKVIKRKPVSSSSKNVAAPNVPSPDSSPLQGKEVTKAESSLGSPNPKSRFSWTTYDASVAPTRPSMDASEHAYSPPQRDSHLHSRFSWSTWNTGNTPRLRSDSPPPSPPPPLPRKYANPPVQSILSRARPIQRADREERTPPPPPMPIVAKKPKASSVAQNSSPASARRDREGSAAPSTTGSSGVKKLPLPPELQSPAAHMSHLDALLRQQEDLAHQRRNTERLIAEHVKTEKASPMQLSFADYKGAHRRLAEHKATLAEIDLEEREIGIAISRARRKEGVEEGLWVRRVTS